MLNQVMTSAGLYIIQNMDEEDKERNKNARIIAWICSSIFAITLLAILIFLKIITPIPAIPPDPEVISVEIGIEDGSGGNALNPGGGSQGNMPNPGVNANADPTPAPATNNADGAVTDPNSTTNVTANPGYQSSLTSQQLADLVANFNKNKGHGSIQLGGNGSGDPYTGGLGNGSGDGPGPGNGGDPGTDGSGGDPNGNTYRHILSKPDIINPTQEEGIVVVYCHVDRTGKVTKVEIGNGGTTSNSTLQATASQSAYKIAFNADNSAPADQLISIDIKFTLR